MTEETATYGAADTLHQRLTIVESRLEVLAAMVETPPPPIGINMAIDAPEVLAIGERIADALETLANTVHAEDEFKHRPEMKIGSWSAPLTTMEQSPCECDCDELWRLAREYVNDGQTGQKYQALRSYVVEHS